MTMMNQKFLLLLFLTYSFNALVTTDAVYNNNRSNAAIKETVLIKPYTDIKYFDLPTSDEPLVSWMDVQKGIFPNTTKIESRLAVGDPVSIIIYLKDKSNLYDLKVTDCWAYDDQNFDKSKNRLHLTSKEPKTKTKLIEKWHKYKFAEDNKNLQILLYTDLIAFKFPDQDQIHITCDIQLCFKSCESQKRSD